MTDIIGGVVLALICASLMLVGCVIGYRRGYRAALADCRGKLSGIAAEAVTESFAANYAVQLAAIEARYAQFRLTNGAPQK